MSYFIKNGSTYNVAKNESLDIHDKLPAGNYVIKEDQFGNLFLEHIDNFQPLKKVYGDITKNTGRICNTFIDRPNSTGVMLTGQKGSGKTLLSKNVCIELAKQDIPTIVINAAWHGDRFNTFIQSIEQPCVILFDEFEKTYDHDEQESILTLLDGVFPTKKLFIITCNDKWRVDYHMRNRPGRIYYMLDFKGLSSEFIKEYCVDNLENKTHIDTICRIASVFEAFNFDMLKALVEEMNRYNENPQEALQILNIKPEFDQGTKYDIKLIYDGKEITSKDINPRYFDGNPLGSKGVNVGFSYSENDLVEVTEWVDITFDAQNLINIDTTQGRFVFEDKGTKLILTKIKEKQFSYDAF